MLCAEIFGDKRKPTCDPGITGRFFVSGKRLSGDGRREKSEAGGTEKFASLFFSPFAGFARFFRGSAPNPASLLKKA